MNDYNRNFFPLLHFPSLHFPFIRLKKNTLTILHNPQIAKLIEAGCAFKSNVIISKNEQKTKKVNNYNEIIITYYNSHRLVNIIYIFSHL